MLPEDIKLGADFLGLIEAFKSHSFLSSEALRCFAVNNRLEELVRRGWIEPVHPGGRWSAGQARGWAPAGKVAECLARIRGARNASEETALEEEALAEVV